MSTDPVCAMEVDEDKALTAVVNGRKSYFCSNECRDAFLSKRA